MRPLIPLVCLTHGGFPLANFKLAFTIECTTQRLGGDEHDEIRHNSSDGFGVDSDCKCARTSGERRKSETGAANLCFCGRKLFGGAEFCVTDYAGLRCENGKWSRDTQLDCAGENMMRQGGGDGHMMPDHMMPHQ
jgi:hypothetical protein